MAAGMHRGCLLAFLIRYVFHPQPRIRYPAEQP